MPRITDSSLIAALTSNQIQPAIFVQVTFSTGTVYIWSGTGQVTWNGQTWTGLGSLLELTPIEDGATVEAKGITITLSGIDPTLLSDCMNEFVLGKPVIVYFGLYSGGSLLPTPVTSWAGRTDQPTIDVGSTEATIHINCENRLIDMNVACDRRYTNQDQQMNWPGDLGFLMQLSIIEVTLFWGRFPNSTNNL